MWTLTERTTNAGIWKATSSESSNSAVSYVDGNEMRDCFVPESITHRHQVLHTGTKLLISV